MSTLQETLPKEETQERLRQYAEAGLAIVTRQEHENRPLTAPDPRATVSPGSEVEPQHLTTQYEQ